MSSPDSSNRQAQEPSRKERKRISDRNAQREHRKRQKRHVEELEAQLTLVKEGGASEVASLLAENCRLQSELKALRDVFDSFQGLLSKAKDQISTSQCTANIAEKNTDKEASELASMTTKSNQTSQDNSRPSASKERNQPSVTLMDWEVQAGARHDDTPTSGAGHSNSPANVPDIDSDYMNLPGVATTFQGSADILIDTIDHQSTTTESGNTDIQFYPVDESDLLPAMGESSLHQFGNSSIPPYQSRGHVDNIGSNLTTESIDNRASACALSSLQAQHNDAMQNQISQNQTMSSDGDPIFWQTNSGATPNLDAFIPTFLLEPTQLVPHNTLPLSRSPPLPSDYLLHWIIERASLQPKPIPPPNLTDFFSDSPSNQLAKDLKILLKPMKYKTINNLLALYWIIYLNVRWQVTLDAETYQGLPKWLRPTETQLTVDHPSPIDLMPWPKLRDHLIMNCLVDTFPSYCLMMDIGISLDINIDLASFQFDNASSRLHEAICDLRNWRLGEPLLKSRPELVGLCDSATAALCGA